MQHWLDLRDAVLLGLAIQKKGELGFFTWDAPGPQSALVRHQRWWFLDGLVLAGITDGMVPLYRNDTPLEQEKMVLVSTYMRKTSHESTMTAGEYFNKKRNKLEKAGADKDSDEYRLLGFKTIGEFFKDIGGLCNYSHEQMRKHLTVTKCFVVGPKGKADLEKLESSISSCIEYYSRFPK